MLKNNRIEVAYHVSDIEDLLDSMHIEDAEEYSEAMHQAVSDYVPRHLQEAVIVRINTKNMKRAGVI